VASKKSLATHPTSCIIPLRLVADHQPQQIIIMSTSIKTELLVENKMGIHARPAAMFVKIASRYEAEIFVEKDGERVNGKSIMGLMMLAAGPGSRLVLEAIGVDASQAVEELTQLLAKRFDEA